MTAIEQLGDVPAFQGPRDHQFLHLLPVLRASMVPGLVLRGAEILSWISEKLTSSCDIYPSFWVCGEGLAAVDEAAGHHLASSRSDM
jgi:hypothetical protein